MPTVFDRAHDRIVCWCGESFAGPDMALVYAELEEHEEREHPFRGPPLSAYALDAPYVTGPRRERQLELSQQEEKWTR